MIFGVSASVWVVWLFELRLIKPTVSIGLTGSANSQHLGKSITPLLKPNGVLHHQVLSQSADEFGGGNDATGANPVNILVKIRKDIEVHFVSPVVGA
jgi:hypothetical protein